MQLFQGASGVYTCTCVVASIYMWGHLATFPLPQHTHTHTHKHNANMLINFRLYELYMCLLLHSSFYMVCHSLDLLTESLTQHLSDASHRMCNVLCQNLVRLEAACSNLGKVQTLLTKLLTTFPSTDGVWLLQAKLSEQKSAQECIDTLSEAVTRCPQSPDIYCYAASVLQATGRNNEATDWLKSCVVQFYEIPEGVEVALADCFILYRYIFNSHSYNHSNFFTISFCLVVLLENFWDNWFRINTTFLHFLRLLMSKSLDWIWFHCGNAICMVMLSF